MGCYSDALDIMVPCKDCKDRKPACHDSCEKFKEFKDKRKVLSDQKVEYYRTIRMFDNYFRRR